MVVNLWRFRGLIVRNSFNDLRHRYSGSVGGYLWNVFVPLAQIVVFGTIFSVLMVQRLPDSPLKNARFEYVIFLCSGLLPWNVFADTVMRGVGSLAGNAGYLKKLAIPEQIFVAQDAFAGFLTGLLSVTLFLLFAAVVAGHPPSAAWLQVIPLLGLFLGLAFGLGLILSCVNVFYRDVQPLMNIVLLLWFWMTPVIYTEDHFTRTPGQEWLAAVMAWNPAYHFLHGFHQALFLSRPIETQTWLTCLAITLAANALAYAVLRSLRPEIRDAL